MKKIFLFLTIIIVYSRSYSQEIKKLLINGGYKNIEIVMPNKSGIISLENQAKNIDFVLIFDDISKIDTCWVTKNDNLYKIITPIFKDGSQYKFTLQLNGNTDKFDLLIGYNKQNENFDIKRLLIPSVPANIQTNYQIYSGGIETAVQMLNIKNINSIDKSFGKKTQSPINSNGDPIQSLKYTYHVYEETNKIVFNITSTQDGIYKSIPLNVKLKDCNLQFTLITLDLKSETPDSKQITFDGKTFYFKPNTLQPTLAHISNDILTSTIGSTAIHNLLKENTEYFIKNNKNELIATFNIKTISESTFVTGKQMAIELQTIKVYKGVATIWDSTRKILLTDIEIKPNPQVQKVEILRLSDWTENLTVRPDERFLLKISGENLINANLNFNSSAISTIPQAANTNNVAIYEVNIADNIQEKEVDMIINEGVVTVLKVEEYQIPCPLNYFTSINTDYLALTSDDYVYSSKSFSKLNDHLLISFDANMIDDNKKMYGVQYIVIEVKVLDNENNIIGVPILKKYYIKPKNGPRASHYVNPKTDIYSELSGNSIDIKSLLPSEPKLNQLNDYKPWETIEISISTDENIYKERGYKKRIVLVNKQTIVIKPSLTIPTGLYVYREGGLSDATGISATALYQVQFYYGNKKKIPLNLGAGFIGLDAINFVSNKDSTDTDGTQDLGIISMLTIDNFIKPDRKSNISFAIHIGGGYLLNNKKWFWLIGPGIIIKIGE